MSIASALASAPALPAGVAFSYGTAGFRTTGELLPAVGYRMGLLMVLQSVRCGCKDVGICVTASHNPAKDNGLKLVDVNAGMLDPGMEKYANRLANASTDALADEFTAICEESGAPLATVLEKAGACHVHVARDTRPTGADIVARAVEAVRLCGAVVLDHGVLTTPQLHTMVAFGHPEASEAKYYDRISAAFLEIIGPVTEPLGTVVIDCANGVGAPKLKALSERLSGVLTFELVNTAVEDPTVLNHLCGGDYVQKEKVFPANMTRIAAEKAFYASVDGDADRLVYLSVPAEGAPSLLDGDRILVLLSCLIRELLQGAAGVTAGAVQTAYANGNSTQYIRDVLKLKVECAATGVKNLHPLAEEMDIGAYFEANGHGTVLFNEEVLARLAAPKLTALSRLLSQGCGDAIGDLLAVQAALHVLKWSVADWHKLYDDLPSRQLKVEVPNPTRITTIPNQTRATAPDGLQEKIDALVKATGGNARSFVRPSGTEPIVRVYAEADTQEACDKLAQAVHDAVKEFLP